MNFPFYIAKRYLFSKSSTNAINIITGIAAFGVIVGTTALFIILSVFSGLRTFSDSLLENSDPDLKITAVKGKSFNYTSVLNEVLNNPEIKAASKVVEERVFLKYKDKQHIAQIKGVDGFYNEVIPIDSSLTVGTWLDPKYSYTAILGYGISYKLSIGIMSFGEPLEILVPKTGKGFVSVANPFRSVETQVVSVYSGSEEFQNKYVFTHLALAQELLNYSKDRITGVEIKLEDTHKVDAVKEKLQKQLGVAYKVQTRAELNALYYKVVNTENFISYLISTLIMIIALFNVIGSIIMMIIDKRYNLSTLFNLGASVKDIKRIFVLQGFLLSVVGMIIGLILGVSLVVLQKQFGLLMITDTLPYPVEFRVINLIVVMLTIIILGYIAAKIASSRITIDFITKK